MYVMKFKLVIGLLMLMRIKNELTTTVKRYSANINGILKDLVVKKADCLEVASRKYRELYIVVTLLVRERGYAEHSFSLVHRICPTLLRQYDDIRVGVNWDH